MLIKKITPIFLLSLFIIMLVSAPGFAEESITEMYIKAYEANNHELTHKIVADNTEKVPAELKTLIYSTMGPKVDATKKESTLFIAEQMAITYKEVTGDFEPLREIKKIQFETKLTERVISVAKNGFHIIETPAENNGHLNYFSPDNLVIKKGETVRWHNTDNKAHLFASFSIIGKGGLFTPNIAPEATWDYTFNEAGEYYYLCFIHKGMLGKITVEE